MKNQTENAQLVYAISSPAHSMVKIGTTTNLTARLAALQTSSAFPLAVIWQHPGAYYLERFLHAQMREYHVQGEWFDLGSDPLARISEAMTQPKQREPRPAAAAAPRTPAILTPPFSTLLTELRETADASERAAFATEILHATKDCNVDLAQIRQAAARQLKDQGLTLKEIGERIGPEGRPLHFSRIQQILKGGPTGRWAKAARDAPAKDEQEE